MRFIVLAGAAMAFAFVASPSAAQPVPPDQPPATTQSSPDAPQAQPLPEPPPFPPMPRARPSHRFTTGGEHRATVQHRTTHVQHRTTRTTHARHTSAKTERRSAHARHQKSNKRHQAAKPSARTVRMCHRMTYEKIMRSSTCRELMSQELKAASNRHHHKAHRKSTANRHKVTRTSTRHSKRHKS